MFRNRAVSATPARLQEHVSTVKGKVSLLVLGKRPTVVRSVDWHAKFSKNVLVGNWGYQKSPVVRKRDEPSIKQEVDGRG